MATLITVLQCDNCEDLVALKTETDWKKFDETWWEGLLYQFCPDCKSERETLGRRIKDMEFNARLIKKSDEEVLNAELIS